MFAVGTRNPGLDQKLSTLDQKWSLSLNHRCDNQMTIVNWLLLFWCFNILMTGIYGYCNCILRTIPWNLQYHQIFYCHVSGCSCLYLCHGNQHNIVPIKHNVSILLFFSCEKLIKCFNSTVYFFFHIGQTFCWIFLQVMLQPIQSWQRDFVELKCWTENKQIGKDLL